MAQVDFLNSGRLHSRTSRLPGRTLPFETGAVALSEARSGGIKATPKLSCKLFQIQRVFVQAFPKKALAVLWNFNALQGPQIKRFHLQTFSALRPPFSLIPDVVAPYSAVPRRSGAHSAVRGRLCCGRAGRAFMAMGSGGVQRYGQREI